MNYKKEKTKSLSLKRLKQSENEDQTDLINPTNPVDPLSLSDEAFNAWLFEAGAGFKEEHLPDLYEEDLEGELHVYSGLQVRAAIR